MSYEERHKEGKLYNIKLVKARQIWFKVLDSQMETGTPYFFIKTHAILNQTRRILVLLKAAISYGNY